MPSSNEFRTSLNGFPSLIIDNTGDSVKNQTFVLPIFLYWIKP